MNHSSPHPKEAGVLVVDRQHRLRNALGAELCIDCSITAYEARTSGEAVALTQAVQPDVVLLDPGIWDAPSAQLLQQILEENTHLGLLVYADTDDVETVAGSLKEDAIGFMTSPSAKHFSFALRRACRETLLIEPDMVHQLFRTWRHDTLEPWLPAPSNHSQLKVLVFALPSQRSNACQFVINRWDKRHLRKGTFACHSFATDVLQLFHYAGHWMSRSCRLAWQLGHAFIASPSLGESCLASTKTDSHARPFHRLSI